MTTKPMTTAEAPSQDTVLYKGSCLTCRTAKVRRDITKNTELRDASLLLTTNSHLSLSVPHLSPVVYVSHSPNMRSSIKVRCDHRYVSSPCMDEKWHPLVPTVLFLITLLVAYT